MDLTWLSVPSFPYETILKKQKKKTTHNPVDYKILTCSLLSVTNVLQYVVYIPHPSNHSVGGVYEGSVVS